MHIMMNGVQKQNSTTTISGFRGAFKDKDPRNKLINLIVFNFSWDP